MKIISISTFYKGREIRKQRVCLTERKGVWKEMGEGVGGRITTVYLLTQLSCSKKIKLKAFPPLSQWAEYLSIEHVTVGTHAD